MKIFIIVAYTIGIAVNSRRLTFFYVILIYGGDRIFDRLYIVVRHAKADFICEDKNFHCIIIMFHNKIVFV